MVPGIERNLLPCLEEVVPARETRIDRAVPALIGGKLRQLDPLLLVIAVVDQEQSVDAYIRAILARIELFAHRVRIRVLPVRRSGIRRKSGPGPHTVAGEILAEEELP